MDALTLIISTISGVVLMPIAQYVKGKLPVALPIKPQAIVGVLAFGFSLLLAYVVGLVPDATLTQLITMSFSTMSTAVITHAVMPSVVRNKIQGE